MAGATAIEQEARRVSMRRAGRWSLLIATVLITVLFSYLALRHIHYGQMWASLRQSNYWWLIPSLALMVVHVAIRVPRWQLLFRRDRRPGYWPAAKATLVGYAFNNLLPARAGEAARIVALKEYAGTSRAESAATIVVERVFDVLSLLIILFVATPWLPHVRWLRTAALLGVILAAGLIAAIIAIAVFGERPVLAVLKPLNRLPFVGAEAITHVASNVVHGLEGLRRAGQGIAAFVLTTVSWLILGLSFWLLMQGFDLHLPPLAGVLVAVAIGLAFIVPAPPAAVGVFEAAGLAALSSYGVPRSHALAYVLVLHALNVFPFLIAGLAVLGIRRRQFEASVARRSA